jgi:galactoside O-acetyltransferase
MLKRIIRRLRGVAAVPPVSSWERFRDYVDIHPTAIIDPHATLRIFNPSTPARPCLVIGAGSHIFGNFALLRPEARIVIGERCQIGSSHFVCADSIEVGDDVLMAWGITLMDNDSHALDWEGRRDDVRRAYDDYLADPSNLIRNKDWTHVATRPIRIGSRSWIGFNAAILKGVTVGENAVVAAHAVLTADAAPFSVVAGNPARTVRTLTDPAAR